jgi:NAD(P)-dependent dehydrogenase (short-subunit alcohol dehydrogenase family)
VFTVKFGDDFYGLVDIIGGTYHGPMEDFDDQAINWTLQRNLLHAVYAAQYAGPQLRKRGKGSMVFISSLAGEIVSPGHAFYGVGKAALNHFMRYCSDEFGPEGVRANCIGTGQIQYASMEAVVSKENLRRAAEGTALRRTGRPIEIAGAVYFLMSDLAGYVTGHVLNVDGGRMIGMSGLPRSGSGVSIRK